MHTIGMQGLVSHQLIRKGYPWESCDWKYLHCAQKETVVISQVSQTHFLVLHLCSTRVYGSGGVSLM